MKFKYKFKLVEIIYHVHKHALKCQVVQRDGGEYKVLHLDESKYACWEPVSYAHSRYVRDPKTLILLGFLDETKV